jgi:hypothetical protein
MTITGTDEQTVRRFYAVLAAQDLATVASCFAFDAVRQLPGTSAITGHHQGWLAIRDVSWPRLAPCRVPRSGPSYWISRWAGTWPQRCSAREPLSSDGTWTSRAVS